MLCSGSSHQTQKNAKVPSQIRTPPTYCAFPRPVRIRSRTGLPRRSTGGTKCSILADDFERRSDSERRGRAANDRFEIENFPNEAQNAARERSPRIEKR